jgi:hypothetical protein
MQLQEGMNMCKYINKQNFIHPIKLKKMGRTCVVKLNKTSQARSHHGGGEVLDQRCKQHKGADEWKERLKVV